MICLPNKIQVEVNLKTIGKAAFYTAGTPNALFSSAYLRIWGIHLEQNERNQLYTLINSGNGIAVKTLTKEFHLREAVTASATYSKQRIRLRNVKNSCVKLDLVLREQRHVDTAATLDLWNFQRASRFWIEDSGSQVTNKIPWQDSTDGSTAATYGTDFYNRRMHPKGEIGLYVASLAFCEPEFVPLSKDDCYGSRSLYRYNNPEVVIEFDANTPDSGSSQALYLDIWGHIHNLLIFQKGDLRKYLV
jgi:hypothetical protein